MSKNTAETHPLFPSGQWEGFYTYAAGPTADRHEMQFTLDFQQGQVTGGGGDDVGGFSWAGVYDTEALICNMTKNYATHAVFYSGHVDENGIWGTWKIQWMSGGFHIWPKKGAAEQQEQAVAKVKRAKKGVMV